MQDPLVTPIAVLFAEKSGDGDGAADALQLTFRALVANVAFEKQVEFHWSDPQRVWRIATAAFVCRGDDREIWEAKAALSRGAGEGAGAPIEFAVALRAGGGEWWDNNAGANYRLSATGDDVVLGRDVAVANLRPDTPLRGRTPLPVAVAVLKALRPRAVHVRWTADQWRSYGETACHVCRWPAPLVGAGPPGRPAAAIWTAELPVGPGPQLEYAIRCDTAAGETIWDNNFGANYVARRDRLRVLTLNLHCFQEENWDAKLSQIARAIDEHEVHIVCLQEVAEPWTPGQPDYRGNAAWIIRNRLKRHYHVTNDWSHLGFGQYREGSAILSRYKVTIKDSGYVSATQDPFNIHARKIVMAQIDVPGLGPVNVFSTHLSWWADGFKTQFDNLRRWADERHLPGIAATLLCGDFNSIPASDGYRLATTGGEYEDQFRKVHRRLGLDGAVANGTDQRIDYIFLKRGSALEAVDSKVLFTPADYGAVSDHPGYYAEFELPV